MDDQQYQTALKAIRSPHTHTHTGRFADRSRQPGHARARRNIVCLATKPLKGTDVQLAGSERRAAGWGCGVTFHVSK